MQHKFCLVDDKVLMTGTLDWGNDRSADHWNYVYITSKSQLVEPVKKEFYDMWGEFCSDLAHNNKPPSCERDTEIVDIKNSETIDVETRADIEPQTMRDTTLTPEVYIM